MIYTRRFYTESPLKGLIRKENQEFMPTKIIRLNKKAFLIS